MKSILTRLSANKYDHVAIKKCKWWGIELMKSRGRRSKDASILMQHLVGHCALSPCSIGTQGAFFSENFHQVTSRSEAEMSRNLFLDFWGLKIEQEKLESTICQKGTLLSTICQGKKRYSFNYLSLVHFFITWQRLGEVVRLPLQAPLVLCSLPPMNILYFCSWIIMLDERGSDFRLIQYDWPYKTRPNSAQKKLKIQEMVEIKRKGIY